MFEKTTKRKPKILRNLKRRERTTRITPRMKNRDQKKLFERPKSEGRMKSTRFPIPQAPTPRKRRKFLFERR